MSTGMTSATTPGGGTPGGEAAGAAPLGFGARFARCFQRMAQVFYAPTPMFRSLGRDSSWLDWSVPLTIGVVGTVIATLLIFPHLDTLTPTREALEARGTAPAAIEQQLEVQQQFMEGTFGSVILVAQGLFYPGFLAVLALVFWGGASAMGGRLTFGRTLSLLSYAWMVRFVEAFLIYMVLRGKPDPVRSDRVSTVLVTNPAAYLPVSQADTIFYAVVSSLNPFTLWVMFLVALGLSETGRLSRGAAFGVVAVLFGIWLAAVAGWTAIF